MDEVAARAVRAESDGVERAAQLGLVLGVAHEASQLVHAVRELTLVAVLTRAVLLERAAQLGLVATRVGGLSAGDRRLDGRAAAAAPDRHEALAGLAVRAVAETPMVSPTGAGSLGCLLLLLLLLLLLRCRAHRGGKGECEGAQGAGLSRNGGSDGSRRRR